MKIYLILEDGTVFIGASIGSECEIISEIVFNTLMIGYPEVLTGLSCTGQVVVTTYPLTGNYGVCHKGVESAKPWPDSYIVRELSRISSNSRSEDTIQSFLKEYDTPGVCDIDTRTFTKVLKEKSIMNGMITTEEHTNLNKFIKHMKEYTATGVVLKATTKEAYVLPGDSKKVVLLDCGAKRNVARFLNQRGCEAMVYPVGTLAERVPAGKPDGIMLSSGLGDPKENVVIIQGAKELYESDVLIFAVCLGYQLVALANGMDIHKLKYGHRDGNHPVKDLETGRVYIFSQNHDCVVNMDNLNLTVAVPVFANINDSINESLKYMGKSTFAVWYHPEACPGPSDSGYLLDHFLRMTEVND